MILFSQIRLTKKKMGVIWAKRKQISIFGPKLGPGGHPAARDATRSTQKHCFFGVPQ